MNIVYIHSHDTGRYIQPYGFGVPTPHLQRFAEEGVLFRHAHCAGPTCSPSRAALLTGMSAHSCGMLGLSGARMCTLYDYDQHLSRYLQRQGYATALSGLQHEAPHGRERELLGYDTYLDDRWPAWADHFEKWNELYAENAADYLLHVDRAKPFFLNCGFSLTHRMGGGLHWHTTEAPPAGDPRYVQPPAPLPDTPEVRQDFADFRVAAALLDRGIGRVLAAIDQARLADTTLVIVTTDHGLASPFMKCNLNDHGTGVMLMLRGPGGFSGGTVVDSLVSHTDIFPTICELANLPAPKWLQGRSLTPVTSDPTASIHDAVFSEVNWHGAPEPMRSVRTRRYRYTRRLTDHWQAGRNCDMSISRQTLLASGWDQRPPAREELYDLFFDPHEACNLAADPAYATILAEHRERLERWQRETDDPALSGRIEPRPGMLLTGPDGAVPAETIVL